jgi:hypothetical protein
VRSPDGKRRRKESVQRRAVQEDSMWKYCRVQGCRRPTRSGSGTGLNRLYCRSHEDHFQRHGSYYQRSYTAAALQPHREAARAFLRANLESHEVRLAVSAIRELYSRAGRPVEVFRLAGRSPEERARAVWARLRESEVNPTEPLAAWLAVQATIRDDPTADWRVEFLDVQSGKLLHRMAGGSHKRWERSDAAGKRVVTELHKYGQSRGRLLRHLGQSLREAVTSIAVDQALQPQK